MSRPTDRQLLEDVHFRVCNPVLFPGLVPTPESQGMLIPGYRFQAPVSLGVSSYLMVEAETVDRVSFRYRWVLDGNRSRDFFAQLGPTPPDA